VNGLLTISYDCFSFGIGNERREIWGFAALSAAKPQISLSSPAPLEAGLGKRSRFRGVSPLVRTPTVTLFFYTLFQAH
jgi:hypothetical protein